MHLGIAALAAAEPLADRPVLRIDPGQHVDTITRSAADSTGKLVATVSDDKTLRLWEVATGRLLRAIRPPIGKGDEGQLRAVAMVADGARVAFAGNTSGGGATGCVYIADTVNGQIIKNLCKLPAIRVNALAWSPDAAKLVATLHGGYGMRLLDATSGAVLAEDADYATGSHEIAMAADGKFFTVALDGKVRAYDAAGRRLTIRDVGGGRMTSSVALSPDGKWLALGFADPLQPRVEVLASADLATQATADVTGVAGTFSRVAWSRDGGELHATGDAKDADDNIVLRTWAWQPNGRFGQFRDVEFGRETIFSLTALPAGGLVVGSAEPALGWFAAGPTLRSSDPRPSAVWAARSGVRVSSDGAQVSVCVDELCRKKAAYDVRARALLAAGSARPLHAHRTRAGQTAIVGFGDAWDVDAGLRVGAVKLPMLPREKPYDVAWLPDDQSFMVGTTHRLCRFAVQGSALWCVPVAHAQKVNVSGDGRLVVAELYDNTVRWYRARDGEELLAFFLHADGKRWLAFTPSGYYDAAVGAESLFGWQVNRGPAAAGDFYPASHFRTAYYRPELVRQVLDTLDERAALAADNAKSQRTAGRVEDMLPPVVDVAAPADGATVALPTVEVHYGVRLSAGDRLTGIRVLVDGRPVAAVVKGAGAVEVPLPPRDCVVALMAESERGVGEPALLHIRRGGRGAAVMAEPVAALKPRLRALAIGTSRYKLDHLNLLFAAADARAVAAAWRAQADAAYREVTVQELLDDQATRARIIEALETLLSDTQSDDVVMLFLAGHGTTDSSGRFFYLPHDVDPARLRATGLSDEELRRTVHDAKGKVVVFIDACRSGSVRGSSLRPADLAGLANTLVSPENGAVVFTASTGLQSALEASEWQHGAFTLALLEAFAGKADYTQKGRVTVASLSLYLSERVDELTDHQQTPGISVPKTVPNFALAVPTVAH